MSKQLLERVAALEVKLEAHKDHTDEKLDAILERMDKFADVSEKQQKLLDALNSRWGFAMLVVSSVGAAILAFKDVIMAKLGAGHPQ